MATKNSYTLEAIETYARENFPLAFEIIADPRLYKFESRRFCTDNGHLIEAELIDFAFWTGPFFGISTWAYYDDGDVCYFYGKLGTDLKLCSPPISSGGKESPIQDFKIPFCYAAARTEPGSASKNVKALREHVRKLARKRLDLLIKFVFLLTGRVTELCNEDDGDLLVQFKDLCMHVQQKKTAAEALHQIKLIPEEIRRTSVSTTANSVDADATETDTTEVEDSQIASSERHRSASIAIRDSKRATPDGDRSTSGAESLNTHKRIRIHASEHTSPQLQSVFESLVQQCKAEIVREATTQEQTSQAEITQLRVELAEQKQKTNEAELKYEDAEEQWQAHHKQQGEMIVNLRVEVKEWKEKYEKLNKKVQIFMKDD